MQSGSVGEPRPLRVGQWFHLNGSLGHEAGYVPSTIHPDWSASTLLLPAHPTALCLGMLTHRQTALVTARNSGNDRESSCAAVTRRQHRLPATAVGMCSHYACSTMPGHVTSEYVPRMLELGCLQQFDTLSVQGGKLWTTAACTTWQLHIRPYA